MSSLSWDLHPKYTCLGEALVEPVEFIDVKDPDLVDEGKVLNLLLYLWLERWVERLASEEVYPGDALLETCLFHPAGDGPPDWLHLGVLGMVFEDDETVGDL